MSFNGCRDNKDLKTRQAKQSMETSKTVSADKSIKTKAERDRRIREMNENNTKKFIEERKRQAMVQSRHQEALAKIHQDQQDNLTKEIEHVSIHIHVVVYIAMKYIN